MNTVLRQNLAETKVLTLRLDLTQDLASLGPFMNAGPEQHKVALSFFSFWGEGVCFCYIKAGPISFININI